CSIAAIQKRNGEPTLNWEPSRRTTEMRKLFLSIALLIILATTALSQTIAITGGKVYPVTRPPIANGTVLIRDGVIVAVGANVNVPASAQRIDATGKIVTPGLINSITTVGLVEIGQVRETNDAAAKGNNNIAAAFKVWDGLIPPLRSSRQRARKASPRSSSRRAEDWFRARLRQLISRTASGPTSSVVHQSR